MKKEPKAVATVSLRHTMAMVWKRLVLQIFCRNRRNQNMSTLHTPQAGRQVAGWWVV